MTDWRVPSAAILIALFWSMLPAQGRDPARQAIYRDDALGFSMSPPGFDAGPDARVGTIAIFTAPPKDEFAANLTVLIQQTGLDKFIEESDRSFPALGFEVVSKDLGKVGTHRSCQYVYKGSIQNRPMKFIAAAIEDGDRVFLITGSSLEQHFDTYAPAFRESLASFKFDK